MPKIVSWDGNSLSNFATNAEFFVKFKAKFRRLTIPNFPLDPNIYQVYTKKNKEFAILNLVENWVAYHAEVRVMDREVASHMPNKLRTASQVAVWRNNRDDGCFGIVQFMFDYFLKTHSIMVTDTEQTQSGYKLWRDLLSETSHFRYALDCSKSPAQLIPLKTGKSLSSYLYGNNKAWGVDDSFKDQLLCISSEDLTSHVSLKVVASTVNTAINSTTTSVSLSPALIAAAVAAAGEKVITNSPAGSKSKVTGKTLLNLFGWKNPFKAGL